MRIQIPALLLTTVTILLPSLKLVAQPRFQTRGTEILVDGQPVYLKGVCYGPFIAGDTPWDSRLTRINFRNDMREIKNTLHANAVRVYQTLPRAFYDAARAEGLFVIQGIHLQVELGVDPFGAAAFRTLRNHVIAEIDRVHAARASDVILCYVIGNEVDTDVIFEMISANQNRARYQGRFFSAPGAPRLPVRDAYPNCQQRGLFVDPHPFQSFIAELADAAATREAVRHGLANRHLFGHASDPTQGIAVSSKDLVPKAVPVDISFLDIVFQNLYSYFPPSVRFRGYRWYLEQVNRAYPDNPCVVLECGYSVSPQRPGGAGCAVGPLCGQPRTPQPNSFCYGRNTDIQQARGILEQFLRTTADPPVTAGFFVFEYYDEWWKSAGPGPSVHEDDKVEQWFGLKAVEGTANRPVVRDRLAFRTVGRMFDSTWCPEALLCQSTVGGVEISLTPPVALDKITLRRNGGLVAILQSSDFPFVDDPPHGNHVYTARIEDALVKCQDLECPIDVRAPIFLRADIDGDGGVVITDGVVLLNFLFRGPSQLICPDAADTDDNGLVNISDGIAVFNFLFRGNGVLPPPPPGPFICGPDPTADALAECKYDLQNCP